MSVELVAALAAFAFIATVTPGPNNLMLMASGANFGLLKTTPHLLGVAVGFPLLIVMVGLGLSRIFALVPASLIILKTASILYLLYLAWRIARAAPVSKEASAGSRPLNFFEAAAFQWVNPKAWAMAIMSIGAYVQPENPVFSVAIIALAFAIIGLPSLSLWTVAGVQVRRLLSSPARLRIFNMAAGLLLAATAIPIILGETKF